MAEEKNITEEQLATGLKNVADAITLVFEPPGPDEPGYLRTQRTALRYQELIDTGFQDVTVQDLDELVKFLAKFIVGTESREAAEEYLWEASENQYISMLEGLTAARKEADEDAVPLESEDGSEDG